MQVANAGNNQQVSDNFLIYFCHVLQSNYGGTRMMMGNGSVPTKTGNLNLMERNSTAVTQIVHSG
jgi:hypothetical protein